MDSNDDSPDKIGLRFSSSLVSDHLRLGAHTFLIPFDDEVSKIVGQVIAYWGAFELRMDVTTKTVMNAMNHTPPTGWERLSFKKRRVLFRDTMRAYTMELFPHLALELDTIALNASDLHWQRNLVAHGLYVITPDTNANKDSPSNVKIVATSVVRGKTREMPLEIKTLQKLWHDISHLTGHLLYVIGQMGGKISSLDIVIPDTDLLQDAQSGNFQILAISERF